MKKLIRILSVALVAVMVLSLSAVALADTPTVYIPQKLAKLNLNVDIDDFDYPALHTKTNDEVAKLYFSEKPDWAGVSLSSLDGGWLNLDVDDTGYAEYDVEGLHRLPGTWGTSIRCVYDEEGNVVVEWPDWMFEYNDFAELEMVTDRGDSPYRAGKDYGAYAVEVGYRRDGSVYELVVTLKDSVDYFRTGMEGAVTKVKFEEVNVRTKCSQDAYKADMEQYEKDLEKYKRDLAAYTLAVEEWEADGKPEGKEPKEPARPVKPSLGGVNVWYISQVAATYPDGNPIVGVEVNYRNDKKETPYSYSISYATSEIEVYKIKYAAGTSTTLEYHNPWGGVNDYEKLPLNKPSKYMGTYEFQGKYWDPKTEEYKTYTSDADYYRVYHAADEVLCGEYYRNGALTAVSGSGKKLGNWYKPGHGSQVKKIATKSCTSFKSPRVY